MVSMVESIARGGRDRACGSLQARRPAADDAQAEETRSTRRGRKSAFWSATAGALLTTLAAALLSGCGQFFAKTTTTTTTTSTTGTGDYFYIANVNTALNTVAGFSFASSALTATTSSPYLIGVTPSTLAITPSNSILYVGSELGGILGYLVGSTGALTSNDVAAAQVSPAAMAVDSTGNWLLVLQNGLTNPTLSAFPINTTTGALTSAVSTITLDAGSSAGRTSLYLVPNSTLVYVALGTGGVDALTFDSSTGTLTKLNVILNPSGTAYSDNGLASDPDGKFLFVTETGINGIRSFTIDTDGTLTALSGSPTTAGSGPGTVLVDTSGAFLYALNKVDNTISAFTLSSTGALSAITGSPFATGSSPTDIVEDNTKGYVAVVCSNGSPDLQIFSITAATGALVSTVTQTTGSVSPAGAYAIVATH